MSNKHKKKPVQQAISPNRLIKERGRTYPIHKCLINKEWREEGLAFIMLIRKMGGDKYLLGSYMVDIFCLGVKDAFAKIVDEVELKDFLKESEWLNEDCEVNLAQNIIYGAMEYAEDLGFKPHPDFALAKYVIDDIEEVEYMDIEFGKNGKPLYIQGENDKYLHILATLDKNVGAGNYDYINELDKNFKYTEGDDVEDDDLSIFEEHAEGLNESDYLSYLFAFKTAMAMDELEDKYDSDFESVPAEARRECFETLREEILWQMQNNGEMSEEDREKAVAFEQENPLIQVLEDIANSLLEGIEEFEQTFAHLPDSFTEVATYFYAIMVKEEYGDTENEGYTDFEEVK